MPKNEMHQLRDAIDETDDYILKLIERRLTLAREMAAAKKIRSADSPLRPKREAAILDRLREKAQLASDRLIEAVWRELIGHGRQAQAPMTVYLYADQDAALLEECARRHFSSAIAVRWAETRQAALQAAYDLPAIAAVDRVVDCPGLTSLGEIQTLSGVTLGFAFAKIADPELTD